MAEEPAWAEHAAWLAAERAAAEESAWADHAAWAGWRAVRWPEESAWADHAVAGIGRAGGRRARRRRGIRLGRPRAVAVRASGRRGRQGRGESCRPRANRPSASSPKRQPDEHGMRPRPRYGRPPNASHARRPSAGQPPTPTTLITARYDVSMVGPAPSPVWWGVPELRHRVRGFLLRASLQSQVRLEAWGTVSLLSRSRCRLG